MPLKLIVFTNILFTLLVHTVYAGKFEKGGKNSISLPVREKWPIIPEFHPTKAVVVSDTLLYPPDKELISYRGRLSKNGTTGNYNMTLVERILEAQVKLIVLTWSKRMQFLQPNLNWLQKKFGKDKIVVIPVDRYSLSSKDPNSEVGQVIGKFYKDYIRAHKLDPKNITNFHSNQIQSKILGHMQEFVAINHPFVRDFGPLVAHSPSGGGKVRLLDFNYYVTRPISDQTPRIFSKWWPWQKVEHVSFPFFLEGGNITCDMSERFVSDHVWFRNSKNILDIENMAIGKLSYYRPEKIQRLFSQNISQEVKYLQKMPFEHTGHLDIWLKHVGPKKLVIASLNEEAMQLETRPLAQRKLKRLKTFLDDQYARFEGEGYDIKKIPMLVPILGNTPINHNPHDLPDDIHKSLDLITHFYSYTNALIINKYVILPRFTNLSSNVRHPDFKQYIDVDYISTYEDEVRRVFEDLGFIVLWAPADELSANFGAVHCATLQIPANGRP